ncbi:hypothetical protein ANO14919_101590 [Xylariales sp. No.14919]|nr:hypothetical protein ANO14919_101590 [Xylariales sp. No.14919]
MEALLFGTDERHEDPATVATRLVRISASGDASRVELTFAGGPGQTAAIVRAIGPDRKSPLKSMDIDGPGGETIASILMPPMPSEDTGFEWYVPQWFGVVTNRGRQGIFGQQASIDQASPIKPPSGFDIVGLFLSPAFMHYWTLGALIAPTTSYSSPVAPAEPCVGSEDRGIRNPDANLTPREGEAKSNESATYLELTKPVVCFRGLLAAPTWCHLDEIGGFEVRFADGSGAFVGTPLGGDQVPLAEKVEYEDFRAGITPVVVDGPRVRGSEVHVETESELQGQNGGPGREWRPGGEQGVRIGAVNVWGGGDLHGIQFEMENGARSPKWGKAGGEPSISFRAHAASGGTFSILQDPARNIAPAKEAGKSIPGIVGLKFVIRKSSGFRSGVPGPVMVGTRVHPAVGRLVSRQMGHSSSPNM